MYIIMYYIVPYTATSIIHIIYSYIRGKMASYSCVFHKYKICSIYQYIYIAIATFKPTLHFTGTSYVATSFYKVISRYVYIYIYIYIYREREREREREDIKHINV